MTTDAHIFVFGRTAKVVVAFSVIANRVKVESVKRMDDPGGRELVDYVTPRQMAVLLDRCRAEAA